jgi:hypothetical protein
MSFLAMRVPVLFGEWYPRRGWEQKRREVIRRALPRVVCRSLGGRLTKFFAGGVPGVPATSQPDRDVATQDGAIKVSTGDTKLSTVNPPSLRDEKWEVVDVENDLWVDEGREIGRMWRELWREMFTVAGVGALGIGIGIFMVALR